MRWLAIIVTATGAATIAWALHGLQAHSLTAMLLLAAMGVGVALFGAIMAIWGEP